MRGLTLHRPWDEPVTSGAKPVENRPNPPPRSLLGEVIAIHAGKVWDAEGARRIRANGFELREEGRDDRIGAIVGVARIAGWLDRREKSIVWSDTGGEGLVTALDEYRSIVSDLDRALGTRAWWSGPVGIYLIDAVAVAPVKCRGMQGWWTVPADVELVVRERARLAA